MQLAQTRAPWPTRVRVLATTGIAVLSFASGLVGMAVTSTTFIGQRAVAQAEISARQADIARKLDELRGQVAANHDDTRREIAAVRESQVAAVRARDGQMARVADKIEAIETDLGRVEGQLGFYIKTTRQP